MDDLIMGTDQHIVGCHDDHENKNINHCWKYLPTEPLIQILELLSYKDLGRCCLVCKRWWEIGNLSFLWHRRFHIDFKVEPEVGLPSTATSWKGEYQRLTDLVPSVEFERILEHEDEVLHVAFSNNGMMFCTCSKDATVKVFSADWPFDTIFNEDLGRTSQFRWVYTQFSQFSTSDTQLLVSGRCEGSQQGGEIIIYNIFINEFTLQARVRIMPYDVMGTWLNETHILSARAHLLSARRQCLCEVLLNKSSQEVENLMHSTVTRAFMFACENGNTVSYLQIADMTKIISQVHRSVNLGCYTGKLHDMHSKALMKHKEAMKEAGRLKKHDDAKACATSPAESVSSITVRVSRNPGEDNGRRTSDAGATCDNKKTKPNDFNNVPVGNGKNDTRNFVEIKNELHMSDNEGTSYDSKKPKLDNFNNRDDVTYHEQSNCFLPAIRRCMAERDNDVDSSTQFSDTVSPQLTDDELDRYDSESTEVTTGDETLLHFDPPSNYKLLVCFTGNNVDVPHQIGIKRMMQEECTEVVRPKFDLEPAVGLYGRPQVMTDSWDHVIDMGGQLVGMSVTPCGRYLYANVRKWCHEPVQGHCRAPDISSHVTMCMIDLISMEEVKSFEGHKAISDVFFLHISCNGLYVASGSEDRGGYLWDRHHGVLLSTFKHSDVVNCVAVNPRDPSMAVSVSDDHSIKIWRSKSFHRLLSGARAKARIKSVS